MAAKFWTTGCTQKRNGFSRHVTIFDKFKLCKNVKPEKNIYNLFHLLAQKVMTKIASFWFENEKAFKWFDDDSDLIIYCGYFIEKLTFPRLNKILVTKSYYIE